MKLSFSFAAWVKVASLRGKVFATSVIARGEPPRALRTTREKGIVVESRSVKESRSVGDFFAFDRAVLDLRVGDRVALDLARGDRVGLDFGGRHRVRLQLRGPDAFLRDLGRIGGAPARTRKSAMVETTFA